MSLTVPNSGTVNDDIIRSVHGLTGAEIQDVRKELSVLEPVFYRWIRDSVKEDVTQISYGGITIHTEEAAQSLSSYLARAKIEGFLIATMSQDREWTNGLFIDCRESEGGVPYTEPVVAMLKGILDREVYMQMEKDMTQKEKDNPEHWKTKALKAFKENEAIRLASTDVKKHLRKEKAKRPNQGGSKKGGDSPPNVELTP